jgi:hypothetical protein
VLESDQPTLHSAKAGLPTYLYSGKAENPGHQTSDFFGVLLFGF